MEEGGEENSAVPHTLCVSQEFDQSIGFTWILVPKNPTKSRIFNQQLNPAVPNENIYLCWEISEFQVIQGDVNT